MFGVEKWSKFLSKEVPGSNIVLAGSTDLFILSKIVVRDPSYVHFLPGVRMLIEVKKEVKSNTEYQAILELIALDLLVARDPVMAHVKQIQYDMSNKENITSKMKKK